MNCGHKSDVPFDVDPVTSSGLSFLPSALYQRVSRSVYIFTSRREQDVGNLLCCASIGIGYWSVTRRSIGIRYLERDADTHCYAEKSVGKHLKTIRTDIIISSSLFK